MAQVEEWNPHCFQRCDCSWLAELMPAGLSAAPGKFTIGFDHEGNKDGFVGWNGTAVNAITLATAAGLLSGTSIGGDSRLIKKLRHGVLHQACVGYLAIDSLPGS